MRTKILILVLILLVIVACTHNVNVPLRPDYQQNIYPDNKLSKLEKKIKFSKGEFSDNRPDISRLASFKQQVHTYNLHEERPLDEAFFEGLYQLMTSSGHEWSDTEPGDVQINLSFLNCQAERNAGLVSVGANSSVQIKLDFIDTASDDLIYSQVYSGTDERSQAMIGLMGMVLKSIDASMIDCINSVGDDENLVRALQKL